MLEPGSPADSPIAARRPTGTEMAVPNSPEEDPALSFVDDERPKVPVFEGETAVPAVLGASRTSVETGAGDSKQVSKVPGQPLVVLETAEAASEAVKEQFSLLVARSPPFVQSYVATIRPWLEFFQFKLPDDGDEVKKRLEQNLLQYCANYLLILLVFLIIMLFSHPNRLMSTIFVLAAWAVYARAGGLDPNWRPTVRGVDLGSSHRLMVMSASSVCFLFFVAGDLVLMLIGMSAMIAMAHAAMHPSSPVCSSEPHPQNSTITQQAWCQHESCRGWLLHRRETSRGEWFAAMGVPNFDGGRRRKRY